MSTNMTPQDILSPPVQQVAATLQLGAFIKTYKATLAGTIGGIITCIVVAALFLAGATILHDTFNTTTIIIFLIFVLLFLGGAISMIYDAIQVANRQIYLFQQGIVIEKKGQVEAFPWNQASEIQQSITRHYRNGRYVSTTYNYTLRRTDGYQIKLNNLTKDIAELGQAIAKGITQELVPRALYSIRAGQTLTFAPFSINQQGISSQGEFIPWQQVQEVNVNRGSVLIKKIGTKSIWKTVQVAKIPNCLVFTIITEELLRQTRSGR